VLQVLRFLVLTMSLVVLTLHLDVDTDRSVRIAYISLMLLAAALDLVPRLAEQVPVGTPVYRVVPIVGDR
jgi:hypothetical protein